MIAVITDGTLATLCWWSPQRVCKLHLARVKKLARNSAPVVAIAKSNTLQEQTYRSHSALCAARKEVKRRHRSAIVLKQEGKEAGNAYSIQW